MSSEGNIFARLLRRKSDAATDGDGAVRADAAPEIDSAPRVECHVQLPEEVVRQLCRRPFCRRHPLLCGLLALVILGFAAKGLCSMSSGDTSALAEEPALALIKIDGPISDVSDNLDWITQVRLDENIVGAIVRVDSPGGDVAASEELYTALRSLAKTKPVVVSMGSEAASGGLMVSMAAERIYANATTVTGSIGVRMDFPQLKRLLDTIGVGQETLTTGPYKAAGDPSRTLTEEERRYFNALIQSMFEEFVSIVAEGRHMDREAVRALANGKIYTGREAVANGLADEIGGFSEAHQWLCEKTGVDIRDELVTMPEEGPEVDKFVSSFLQQILSGLAGSVRHEQAPAFRMER
ncbi:MAG: signal peptide peptidase SppA [Desulfovibrionaceae bacterium]|nr:signal peptide peptidase SppA [Desulfovibrionaceae bacterium]